MGTAIGITMGFLAASAGQSSAEDWPSWRGPRRDGICAETGLLKRWPTNGPKLLWKATGLGEGYSGPAVVGEVIYILGSRDRQQWVLALDAAQRGRPIWSTSIGPVRHEGGGYPGPRSTPTVDGNRVYVLGIGGELVCLETQDGRIVWQRSLENDLGGAAPNWGYAESVLIDGPWLVCTPGGAKATLAALSKADGKPVWTSPIGDPAAYSSVIRASIGQVRQYVQLTAKGVVGVQAEDGRFLWRYDRPANGTANVSTPVWYAQTIFAASDYGTGGGLVWPKKTGDGFQPEELYSTRQMKNHHGGMILLDGCLYGADDPGLLTCLDYRTGKVNWSDRTPGKCSLLYADGMLYARSEDGPVCLVEANAARFSLKGRLQQPQRSGRKAWPHPVISHGRLLLRDQDLLLCYDVRAARPAPATRAKTAARDDGEPQSPAPDGNGGE
jgi:outer membrane protein assembly factor BamB